MSARVIDLESRRPQPCDCPPHLLTYLSSRLRQARDAQAGELLVSADTFTAAMDDALKVIDRIVGEHAVSHGRSKP